MVSLGLDKGHQRTILSLLTLLWTDSGTNHSGVFKLIYAAQYMDQNGLFGAII